MVWTFFGSFINIKVGGAKAGNVKRNKKTTVVFIKIKLSNVSILSV
jgi:hypothetical protein